MQHQSVRSVLLVALAGGSVTACEPSASTLEVPRTDVTLEEPLQPSALVAMGIGEKASGSYAQAERATRSVTALVAGCLRPMLEREPWLTGTLSYRWDVERPSEITVGGDLASFAAAACAKDALGKAAVPANAKGSIAYDLEVKGTYVAKDLTDEQLLAVDVEGLDWSGPGVSAPQLHELGGTQEKLRRCAFGAAPALEGERWLVIGVNDKGKATLAPGEPEGEADACIRRALASASFATEGRPYGLSVLLRSFAEVAAVEVEEPERGGAEFGMIGLLNSGAGGEPGSDEFVARGNMWGDAIGDSFGAGGLGLTGIGQGGGGIGEGTIGLGTIGTIGGSKPTTGAGTGQGFGTGSGRLGGTHRTKPPQVKMGATSVSGRLPPEVIQRIVRQNFGRFRLCYENGLKKNSKLAGKVSVSFEIARDGSVTKVTNTTTLTDKAVASCVSKAFFGLSFPQPEGGVVKVTYPILFSPGDGPPPKDDEPAEPAPPPPPPAIGGTRVSELTMEKVEARLDAMDETFVAIPGAPGVGGFVRKGDDVLAVFLTADGNAGFAKLTTCRAEDAGRALLVRGARCERVMQRLLD